MQSSTSGDVDQPPVNVAKRLANDDEATTIGTTSGTSSRSEELLEGSAEMEQEGSSSKQERGEHKEVTSIHAQAEHRERDDTTEEIPSFEATSGETSEEGVGAAGQAASHDGDQEDDQGKTPRQIEEDQSRETENNKKEESLKEETASEGGEEDQKRPSVVIPINEEEVPSEEQEPNQATESQKVEEEEQAIDNNTIAPTNSASDAINQSTDDDALDEKEKQTASSQPIAFATATPIPSRKPAPLSAVEQQNGGQEEERTCGRQDVNSNEKAKAALPKLNGPSQPGAFSVAAKNQQQQTSESAQNNNNNNVPPEVQQQEDQQDTDIITRSQKKKPSPSQSTVATPPSTSSPPATEEPTSNATATATATANTDRRDSKHAYRQLDDEESEPVIPMIAAECFGQAGRENTITSTTTAASTTQAPNEETSGEAVVPMIEAELVAPPVQAVHVIYDEHPEANNIDPEQQHQQQQASTHDNSEETSPPAPFEMEMSAAKEVVIKLSLERKLLYGLCCLAIVLAITIPVSIYFAVAAAHSSDEEDEEEEHVDMESATATATAAAATTVAPTFPYECFSNTSAMIEAQFTSPEQNLFIMCPGMRLKMGYLNNPTAGDTRIVDGDIPLMVVRDNVEVRCGLDGSVNNNCVFEGGFLQVLFQPLIPSDFSPEKRGWRSTRTDNVTIRGMTFSGQLVSDYTLGGSSVVISNPGHNVQIVDCKWENMTAPSGLFYVGTNPFQLYSDIEGLGHLELHDADVTIVNSTFRNITYDGSLLENVEQVFAVRGCKFQDIRLSAYASYCGYWHDDGFCQSLLYCLLGGICALEDLCVSNFEYANNASIMVAHTDAEFQLSGSNFLDKIKLYQHAEGYEVCESGFAWLEDATGIFECMKDEELSNWTSVDTCPNQQSQ